MHYFKIDQLEMFLYFVLSILLCSQVLAAEESTELTPTDNESPVKPDSDIQSKGKSLDSIMDGIFAEIGKNQVGIDGLDSLKRDKCETNGGLFRCEATASKASIEMQPEHKLEASVKLWVRGKIRRGRLVRLRMEDAAVEVKSMPAMINMWRPRALRRIERQLRRQYLRLAIATKRTSRRMLPAEVAN